MSALAWFGLAAVFTGFLGVIIYLADTGGLGFLYSVYDFPYGDKVGHLVLFGLLMLLLSLGMLRARSGAPVPTVIRTGLALAALVTIEEATQLVLPSRTPDPLDLVAGYLGIAAAGWAALRLSHLFSTTTVDPGS